MEKWKFYDITHREHVFCNPMSVERLGRFIELLRLPAGALVAEVACGKGEFIIRLAEKYGVTGIGVDISPFCVADAKQRLAERIQGVGIKFLEMDGAEFSPDMPNSLDLAACIGASWIYGGHAGTLEALIPMVKQNGWVIIGEPHWRRDPSKEYLAAIDCSAGTFSTCEGNVRVAEEKGLRLVYSIVSEEKDWDEYEGLQWYAADEYSRKHADDPDVTYLQERISREKHSYLKWGRDTLGFAVYAFRKVGA
ncbi:MAG: class I SAM-dependent methyltransferase [Candidatus Eisenbacteria bacterium]|uniref:Class I SAM-dependent methyltransferase n=1 Tax=Eiseniibacteriota bacterium TaxID=2212470 RepID=A0A948RTR5_UNCEI|nr:class I SAM-dependent methyltransferase [Candidatus Eisenbacteria bacterium]MBU1947830.1 class I SAM-dependent methyltransferase [Candidatus Eisenbacteria bacterium]MBU2689297.1 class I SAM-dependent methyltransferase [Candidatus Eisenbacteria bacterium]